MADIPHQYRIVAAGTGWRRRRERGRLRFSGADRQSFLQALVTNDVGRLTAGQGAYAAYLTPQGRLVSDMWIHARADDLVASVPAALAERLAALFDGLIFAEDVRVEDETAALVELQVAGGGAADLLGRTMGVKAAALAALPVGSHAGAGAALIARADDASLPVFDVIVPAGDGGRLEDAMAGAGAVPMSEALAESLRIDAARPAFGVDMDEHTIPLEAGLLDRAISTTKGCYVGQEVIIRVLHRGGGRVARRLVRIDLEPGAPPPARGTIVRADGCDSGRVTSAASAPDGSRAIALAWVHRDQAEVGRTVRVDSHAATITAFAG